MNKTLFIAALIASPLSAQADNLYSPSNWSSLASDQVARGVGDSLVVVVYEAAEARNSAQNSSRKSTSVSGDISTDAMSQNAGIGYGGNFTGQGEVRRSEQFVTQVSVTIREVLPNGDFLIEGGQNLLINGERTDITLKGRIRAIDVSRDNTIISTRIADAEINYDGSGFVSRSAKPGLINRIFNVLGLS